MDPVRRWGEGAYHPFPHPTICQTTGPILYPKTAFDSPGHEHSPKTLFEWPKSGKLEKEKCRNHL